MNINTVNRFKQNLLVGSKGLSLVELMVAITIGLFLIGGVIQIYVGSKATYRPAPPLHAATHSERKREGGPTRTAIRSGPTSHELGETSDHQRFMRRDVEQPQCQPADRTRSARDRPLSRDRHGPITPLG